jgi:hypothetical protein
MWIPASAFALGVPSLAAAHVRDRRRRRQGLDLVDAWVPPPWLPELTVGGKLAMVVTVGVAAHVLARWAGLAEGWASAAGAVAIGTAAALLPSTPLPDPWDRPRG